MQVGTRSAILSEAIAGWTGCWGGKCEATKGDDRNGTRRHRCKLLGVRALKYRLSIPWLLIFVFFIFPIAYLYTGLMYESRISSYARVFSTIGDRAIQLDRVGSVGEPVGMEAKISIEKSVIDFPGTISCTSKIFAKDHDPRERSSTEILIDGILFPDIYLIYNGRPPDFDKFFDKKTALKLLGPQKYFFPDRVNPILLDTGDDYFRDFQKLIMGRNYGWHSTECENFTYTVFWLNYFGWKSEGEVK